jgi:iron(III) transport system permease protein
METLNDYGAVKHFGISTFTNGIFRTWFALNDLSGALRLAALLMLFILSLLVVERLLRSGAKFEEKGNFARPFQRYRLGPTGATLAIACCLVPLTCGFLIPLGRLSLWASDSYRKILDSSFVELVANSLSLAVASSLLIVLTATFLAFAGRYFKSPGVHITNRLAILGYSVPGAVVAMAIMLVAGPLNLTLGILLTGSLLTLLFAYLIRFLAVAWQPVDSGMEKNCDLLNEASQSLKASPLVSLLKINLPLIRPSLWAAGLLVFVDTMKELPLTLILRPFNFETLSTRTYDLTNQAQIPESSVPAMCIILVVVFPVVWLNRKMEAPK